MEGLLQRSWSPPLARNLKRLNTVNTLSSYLFKIDITRNIIFPSMHISLNDLFPFWSSD
jgi:hypothetical protein